MCTRYGVPAVQASPRRAQTPTSILVKSHTSNASYLSIIYRKFDQLRCCWSGIDQYCSAAAGCGLRATLPNRIHFLSIMSAVKSNSRLDTRRLRKTLDAAHYLSRLFPTDTPAAAAATNRKLCVSGRQLFVYYFHRYYLHVWTVFVHPIFACDFNFYFHHLFFFSFIELYYWSLNFSMSVDETSAAVDITPSINKALEKCFLHLVASFIPALSVFRCSMYSYIIFKEFSIRLMLRVALFYCPFDWCEY